MEYLGYVFETPEIGKDGKWKPVELTFDEQEDFNIATSKLIKIFKSPDGDGKCIVSDSDGEKYMMDIVHSTFDVESNSFKVFPVDCKKMK